MKNVYILGIVLMSVALVATMMPSVQMPSSQAIDYNSMVCIYKNNELIECSENALTDVGKNYIKTVIGQASGAGAAMDFTALGNASTPTSGSTSLTGEITDNSLQRAQGTYNSVGTGNWSITKTFTASGAVGSINTTALFNASSSGTMFAYNTFTDVSLQNADQINVTWTIWVT